MILSSNPFAQKYKMLREKIEQTANREMVNFRMYMYRSNLDPKLVSNQRYHDVAINGEIAEVFAEEDGQVPSNIHVN